MRLLKTFIRAGVAGVFIGIGGTAFLLSNSKLAGSLLFCAGLFAILTMNFNLFTGKVCYVFENKLNYLLDLIVIWIGNLVGALSLALLESFTRLYPTLNSKAIDLVNTKFVDEPISWFILGVLCNILIYLAVDGYKNNEHELGKYLSIIFGVTIFVFCGFEHCIADMYYISIANAWRYDHAFEVIAIVTIGNCVGGILIPLIKKFVK